MAEQRVYHVTCPCGADSGERASSETAERWFVYHVRSRHPEHVDEVTRAILAGENKPVDFGHLHDEDGIVTATCRACGERSRGMRSAAAEYWLLWHWIALHSRWAD